MSATDDLLSECRDAHAQHPSGLMYALIDAAQDESLMAEFLAARWPSECLFGYAADAHIAQVTPRLVQLPVGMADPLSARLVKAMYQRPVATLLTSPLNLKLLTAHLRQLVDVQLEDMDSMFLALWDPAILGTLVGQADDLSLHVPGPVLDDAQRHTLLAPISAWWYCCREGRAHRIAGGADGQFTADVATQGFELGSEQIDALVEASVPDHLLHHISQNQPELLERLEVGKRYAFVCQQLHRARAHGIEGMGDLTNYVCVALAYGARFDEFSSVMPWLEQVRSAKLSFDQALDRLSETELSAAAQAPMLLEMTDK
jgi:Domain of unknown function (DUF4123)